MALTYSRITPAKNNPRFCVTIRWDYGEGHDHSYHTTQQKLSEPTFLDWLAIWKKFELACVDCVGSDIAKAEELADILNVQHKVYITDNGWVSAVPSIDKIEFVDAENIRYTVGGY